jgi:hypothetical protein
MCQPALALSKIERSGRRQWISVSSTPSLDEPAVRYVHVAEMVIEERNVWSNMGGTSDPARFDLVRARERIAFT